VNERKTDASLYWIPEENIIILFPAFIDMITGKVK